MIPGDDFFVSGVERDGQLTELAYLAGRPAEPKNMIHVRLQQSVVGGHDVMLLDVENTFERPLIYHALFHVPKSTAGEYQPTSTCPVRPKVTSIETWPHAISTILLGDFRLVDAPSSCKYY